MTDVKFLVLSDEDKVSITGETNRSTNAIELKNTADGVEIVIYDKPNNSNPQMVTIEALEEAVYQLKIMRGKTAIMQTEVEPAVDKEIQEDIEIARHSQTGE